MRLFILLPRYRLALHKLKIREFTVFSSSVIDTWRNVEYASTFFDIYYDIFPEFYKDAKEASRESANYF